MYSLISGSWKQVPLSEGARPVEVLASTYRLDDGRVYEIDRDGIWIRFRSWAPGDTGFRTLASLPAPWQAFDRTWLVTSTNGDLIVASTGRHSSVLARWTVSLEGSLKFAGLRFLSEEILAAPGARNLGITYSVPEEGDKGAIARFLAFEDMKLRPRGWEPESEPEHLGIH